MLDVQQLTVLVGVAKCGSYTAAAEHLGYTQPAVSYRMRSLERIIGAPIAERSGRGIRLTPAGERLAEHAEKILAALRAAEVEFGVYAAQAHGRIRVSAVRSACVALLPGAVARLQEREPGIEVVLDETASAEARGLLRAGETDLTLLGETAAPAVGAPASAAEPAAPQPYGPHPDTGGDEAVAGGSGMLRLPLLTDRRCVLLPAGHRLARRGTLALADLRDQRWVLPSDGDRTRFTVACAAAGFEPRVAATTDDGAAAYGLVANGAGVALAHGLEVPARTEAPVLARPLAHWPARCLSALLWPDSMRLPAVAALVAAVRVEVAERVTAADARRAAGTGEYAGGAAGTAAREPLIRVAGADAEGDRGAA